MKVTFDAPEELVAELRRRAVAEDRSFAAELRVAMRWRTLSPLARFVAESNRIEGINRLPTQTEIDAHAELLALPAIDVPDLERFVQVVARAPLRERPGQNVRVGPHTPPAGGPHIRVKLDELLHRIRLAELTPMRGHVEYETLHPFMDGNGRSGRALWAWQTQRDGRDPLAIGFLHAFYYQALNGLRR
ncbi:MAG TPA: Fic family protein [Solirubrobacteraceae bacterium]